MSENQLRGTRAADDRRQHSAVGEQFCERKVLAMVCVCVDVELGGLEVGKGPACVVHSCRTIGCLLAGKGENLQQASTMNLVKNRQKRRSETSKQL